MKKKKLPDWLIRSLKTFIQSFLAYILTNWGIVHNRLVSWDFSDWQSWVLPLFGAAISFAVCAVWNGVKEVYDVKGGPEE